MSKCRWVLISSIVAIPCALAQEPADDTSLPTIYVRDVMPSDAALTPGAGVRLTDAQIEALRPYSMHDALDLVSGVRTIDDDVLGRRSGIGVRGAPPRRSRKTLLLEDGAPINASTYLDSSAHYTPPLERLEAIDVLKAAGQIVHGPLNNHGIVNFRNKRATETPETSIELVAGTLDTLRRHVMHRRTVGRTGIVASYTGMDANGSFDLEDTRYDDLFGSVDWAINESQSLAVSLTYFRERSHYDESNLTPQEYAIAPRTKRGRFGQEHNTFALDYRKLDAMHDVSITDRLSMSTKLFAIDVDRPRFTVVPGDSPVAALPEVVPERPFEAGVTGRMESRDRQYRVYGLETRMELASLGAADRGHTLQWGVRIEEHSLDDMRHQANGGVVLSRSQRGALIRSERYEASAVSAFFQDMMRFGDFTVIPGLRAETFTQSKVRESIAADLGPHDPKEKDRNSVLLPGVSVLFDGLENVQLFGNVQRGYSPAIARTAAGFPLTPEVGLNTQLGFRMTALDRLDIEAAVFYNRLEDTLIQQAFTIDGLNVTLNSGDSIARGFDAELRFDSAPEPTRANLFAELAYNYTDARFRRGPLNDYRVPEVPLHAGSMTLGVGLPSGWQLSATWSHFGSFYTDVVNTGPITLVDEDDLVALVPGDDFSVREPVVVGRVSGRTLLSARLSYVLPRRNATLWVQGRNLTDKLYISDLENGIRPGAERTIVAGVQLRL